MRGISLIFISIILSNAPLAWGESYAGICDLYLEKSEQLGCSDSNYLTQFGYKYCNVFLKKNDKFKPSSQMILKNIRECLIESLISNQDLTCDSVERYALESHVECYIQNDFCSIKGVDKFQIYWYLRDEIGNKNIKSFRKKIKNYCDSL